MSQSLVKGSGRDAVPVDAPDSKSFAADAYLDRQAEQYEAAKRIRTGDAPRPGVAVSGFGVPAASVK